MTKDYFDRIEWLDVEVDARTKRAVMAIDADINEEDFGIFAGNMIEEGIKLQDIKSVAYDSAVPEFEEWIYDENNAGDFDGGYVVTLRDGTVKYYCWEYGEYKLYEMEPKKITVFIQI